MTESEVREFLAPILERPTVSLEALNDGDETYYNLVFRDISEEEWDALKRAPIIQRALSEGMINAIIVYLVGWESNPLNMFFITRHPTDWREMELELRTGRRIDHDNPAPVYSQVKAAINMVRQWAYNHKAKVNVYDYFDEAQGYKAYVVKLLWDAPEDELIHEWYKLLNKVQDKYPKALSRMTLLFSTQKENKQDSIISS